MLDTWHDLDRIVVTTDQLEAYQGYLLLRIMTRTSGVSVRGSQKVLHADAIDYLMDVAGMGKTVAYEILKKTRSGILYNGKRVDLVLFDPELRRYHVRSIFKILEELGIDKASLKTPLKNQEVLYRVKRFRDYLESLVAWGRAEENLAIDDAEGAVYSLVSRSHEYSARLTNRASFAELARRSGIRSIRAESTILDPDFAKPRWKSEEETYEKRRIAAIREKHGRRFNMKTGRIRRANLYLIPREPIKVKADTYIPGEIEPFVGKEKDLPLTQRRGAHCLTFMQFPEYRALRAAVESGKDIDVLICFYVHVDVKDETKRVFSAHFARIPAKATFTEDDYAKYQHAYGIERFGRISTYTEDWMGEPFESCINMPHDLIKSIITATA